jgi:soluble lytic murein transglycosylase-like protein
MAKRPPTSARQRPPARPEPRQQRALPVAIGIVIVLAGFLVVDSVLLHILPFNRDQTPAQAITDPNAPLASFFTPEVLAWRSEILQWAKTYGVNPNVIAIVIQIESCGSPAAMSGAGALGLMQVMPFHFEDGENMLNPDTNVQRGMTVFYECLTQFADWDLGMALACYNGGPSVTQSDYALWADETQHYYRWATGLWHDVVKGNRTSETLTEWLKAGGAQLCDQAARLAAKQKP